MPESLIPETQQQLQQRAGAAGKRWHPHSRPTQERLAEWLSEVPDPEIPVVSIVELGMLRRLAYDADTLVITITPTYSGCPATAIIKQLILAKLHNKGVLESVAKVRVDISLSPAWTTDWMTAAARTKLKNFGIAPPIDGTAARGLPAKLAALTGTRAAIACPRCGSENTEKISEFGSTPCKAAYRCRACLEPFDYFKCI